MAQAVVDELHESHCHERLQVQLCSLESVPE